MSDLNRARAIEPEEFPWYDYRGFTFSLGLLVDGHAINSGHSGSAFDPEKGKPGISGSMADQARIAYAKQAAVLESVGLSMADVTRVVENVTMSGLPHYAEAEQVRREVFGDHQPTVVTVMVDRLVRRQAFIEVEVHASPKGGSALVVGSDDPWVRGTIREGHDGEVYLPTLLPIDDNGAVVAPGDIAAQYAYCLERASILLDSVGLTLANVVSTIDYLTPESRETYPIAAATVRTDRLGPVYPAAAAIVMTQLHEPGVLISIDVVANRQLPEAVNPGWSRYDTLTYNPAVRAGDTLYLSGFASLDQTTGQAVHPGDFRAQATNTYNQIREVLAAVGAGPENLLTTVEYVTPDGLGDYRVVADVRRELLAEPYPASTGIVCNSLLQSDFLMEVVATALIPTNGSDTSQP